MLAAAARLCLRPNLPKVLRPTLTQHSFPGGRAALSRAYCMSTKRMAPTKIGTHDGSFHCDEALGCYLLKQTKQFREAEIVRSRDPETLGACDIVIDVGAVYEPENNRFDHHQRGFEEIFGHGFVTKLSSAGLVYKHFGREIVATTLALPESDPIVEKIYLKVYKSFIEGVDGIDNGVNMYDTDAPAKYSDNTGLSARVGKLNPAWNEDNSPATQMTQFTKAVALTGSEFDDAVKYYGLSWLPARKHVEQALDTAKEVHPSGEILKLPCYCPWKDHLFELEAERGTSPLPKYALYEDDKGNWRIQAIPLTPSSFENRKPLPAAWRGIRDSALDELSGIEGCIFVHAAGFIGGNKTYEGALAMATQAMTMD